MRKIKFDEETINEIKSFIEEGHSKREACNRFTIKIDTLNRVMRENDIKPFYTNKSHNKLEIKEETINLVCSLFKNTDTRIRDICKEAKLKYWEVQEILKNNFTQYEIDSRKSRLYRNSKLGDKNPMTGKSGDKHPNYKGEIDDGAGYVMVLKPDWYTGRKRSAYVFKHSVVMCEHLGLTEIPEGFVVHHIDGNKKNNDISNLALMKLSGHSKLHQIQNNLCKVQRLSENGVGE